MGRPARLRSLRRCSSRVPMRRSTHIQRFLFALLMLHAGLSLQAADPDPQGVEFFEAKIRPVLVQQCYGCHSAEAAKQGKLRGHLFLDTRDASRKGGETGPAVVPNKPEESLLLSALKHESFEMPPKGKLPEAVIADFEKWIAIGAPDPREGTSAAPLGRLIDIAAGRDFWSFKPLTRIDPPRVADDRHWGATPIDQFILAGQNEIGIHPNPIAEPRVLVRRAWFDLLGLPPTPEETASWTSRLSAGAAPGTINRAAWDELLDHLLASPHYGERWARHWIDIARFAESHGYEQDYDRPTAYHYRDFLIKAFNDDLPYDTFVQWQLAGDELAPDTPLAWMATGFLGGGAFPTQLTEKEFESARYDELDDMVATTGVAFLGLSLGCCRCHDHKYDPIPSRDYYELAASFTTAIRSEKEFDLQPDRNATRRKEFAAKQQELTDSLQRLESEQLPIAFREWLSKFDPATQSLNAWEVLEGQTAASAGSKFQRQADGSYLAQGAAPAQEVLTFTSQTNRQGIAALRLEALADPSLPNKGPGRASNGNFALGDIKVSWIPAGGGDAIPIKLSSAKASHQQNDSSLSVAASIDADPVSGWAVDGQIGRDQAAVFIADQPIASGGPVTLVVTMTFNHPNKQHAIGRFRLSVGTDPNAEPKVGNEGPDARVLDALAALKAKPEPGTAEWKTGIDWFKTIRPEWQTARKALDDHIKAGPGVELTKILVTTEGLPHLPHHADGRGFPHFYPETYYLRRGDVEQKDGVAKQGFLQVLMRNDHRTDDWHVAPPAGEQRTSYRRATLARWITDVDNGAGPLAARVIVNRLWQHHFGRGIVATPNDLGAAGERPTHPELLNWLASQLIDGGWKLKPLHKLIMSSTVYMQSTAYDEQRASIDRENTTYWRRVPRRLEAEPIRDSLLAVAGQLDLTMYGPGSLDENMKRRSVYFFIKRSQLIPTMMLFDWPEHLVSIGQRSSTTIAPQALMFMNSPLGRQAAHAFAGRLPTEPSDAVTAAYELAYGRQPAAAERQLALEFLDAQKRLHEATGKPGPSRLALTDLCQTLLSMNEFVYIE